MILHSGKVLIVTGERQRSSAIADLLRHHGCRVRCVENGATGLLAIHEERPCVVFLAAEMPIMNGFQLLSVVRADAALSQLPMILMMSSDSSEALARAGEAGADLCLSREAPLEDYVFLARRALSVARQDKPPANCGSPLLGRLSA